MGGVTITELIDKMGLRNMTPELETDNVMLVHADVNRPALQLTGFFDHFDKDRVQIIGYVENAYISTLTPQRRREMFDKLLSSGIPCLVYSRGMAPEEEVLELCNHYGVPCMVSEKTTSDLMAEIIRWLNVKMAPMISIHGVLVDVFGEGVLIMGESGIGKSEAALELIKRGHRLVSDDVVNEGYPANWCRPGAIRDSCRVGDLTMVIVPIVAVFIYINININVYTKQ